MDRSKQTEKANLIEDVRNISKKTKGRGFIPDNFDEVQKETSRLCDLMRISPLQAILLSAVINVNLDTEGHCTIKKLSGFYDCDSLDLLAYINDLDVLVKKELIKKETETLLETRPLGEFRYEFPSEVFMALQNNDRDFFRALSNNKKSLAGFFRHANNLSIQLRFGMIYAREYKNEMSKLIGRYSNCFPIVRFIDDNLDDVLSKGIVASLLYEEVEGERGETLISLSESFYRDMGERIEFTQAMLSGKHELIRNGFIDLDSARSRMFLHGDISLANRVISEYIGGSYVSKDKINEQEVMPDLENGMVHERRRRTELTTSSLIKHKNIIERKLYFNKSVQDSLSVIRKALSPGKFEGIKKKLKERDLPSGFIVLQHGNPGTGKTEFVYQLAKETKRDIMFVDISSIQSKYIGQNERLMQRVFDEYKRLRESNRNVPILLFNEADAFFSKRLAIQETSNNTVQGHNTVMNILLQQLEDFDGILFATTNLDINMDKAFDRRFLFKIKFDNPDENVRKMLWRNFVPELSGSQVAHLASNYEYTGGEINNIVRRIILKSLVADDGYDMYEEILMQCEKGFGREKRNAVGFRA